MRRRVESMAMLVLMICGVVLAQVPLNPTVKVMSKPGASVAAECEDGMAPQPAPRVLIADVPAPARPSADLQPPPSRTLRGQIAEVQSALERNDRPAFEEWLTSLKATVANYPPGGEKTEAQNVITVYDDIKRLWDYQFANPSGAFFDGTVQDGSLIAALRRYPGYENFIRDYTIEADGVRIYPVRESRDFLAREAAKRVGVRTAIVTPAPMPAPVPAPVTRPTKQTTTTSPAPTKQTTPKVTTSTTPPVAKSPTKSSTKSSTTKAATKPAATKPATTKPATTKPAATKPATTKTTTAKPAPTKVTKPVTTSPSPRPAAPVTAKPVSKPPAPKPVPRPEPELPTATSIVSTPAPVTPATQTAATATTSTQAMATETTATQPPITTETTATVAQTTSPIPPVRPVRQRGNIIFSIVLIVAALGVLWLLFRAPD